MAGSRVSGRFDKGRWACLLYNEMETLIFTRTVRSLSQPPSCKVVNRLCRASPHSMSLENSPGRL